MRDTMIVANTADRSLAGHGSQNGPQRDNVLGVLCYSTDGAQRDVSDPGTPCLRVPMRRLYGDAASEAWLGDAPLTQGRSGDIQYRHDGRTLFGAISLPESRFEGGASRTPLQRATLSAYRQIFMLMGTLDYRHLLRCWNYMPDINGYSSGAERYRQFNAGRQEAFAAQGLDGGGSAPAASALGSAQGPLCIAFLAGRQAPLRIENPRQLRACDYPLQYSLRSPIFSRAALVTMRETVTLWISGTASIVGHASLHPGDVDAQLDETLRNISTVLTEANRLAGPIQFGLDELAYKVYLRRAADLARVRAGLQRAVGDALKAVYLEADVCREELLLEIEATATSALGAAREGGN